MSSEHPLYDSALAGWKSGIYGLFRLDGGHVEPRDSAALGLPIEPAAAQAKAVDPHAPASIHSAKADGVLTILLGDLEEPEALAEKVSMPRETPPGVLARAALRRFGGDTPIEMIGEWSLLQWDPAGELTLMMSAARRDPLLFAMSGPNVAVAPDLSDWIGLAGSEPRSMKPASCLHWDEADCVAS